MYGRRGADNTGRVRASFFGFPLKFRATGKKLNEIQLDAHVFVTFAKYLEYLRVIFVQIVFLKGESYAANVSECEKW